LIATMTRSTAHDERWSGATGRFTEVQIRRTVRALASPVCYVVGPPLMVHAMRQMLAHVDVDDDDIRSEEFYGY
jgi:ferredoxin-NADP reductase